MRSRALRFSAPLLALSFTLSLFAGGWAQADEAKAPEQPAAQESAADRMFRLRVDVAITRGAEWLAK